MLYIKGYTFFICLNSILRDFFLLNCMLTVILGVHVCDISFNQAEDIVPLT